MALATVEQQKEKILGLLRNDNVTTVVLVGQHGIGKTWMARELTASVIRDNLFDSTLWLCLNRRYDHKALHENIAHQLSLFSSTEEWEDDDDDDEEEEQKEQSLEDLQSKILKSLKSKRCLLILDDEGNKMKEEEIWSKLEDLLPLKQQNLLKVLITTLNSDHDSTSDGTRTVIQAKHLSVEESRFLLQKRIGITASEFRGIEDVIIGKTKGLPAAILWMAEALRCLRKNDSGVWILESVLEDAVDDKNVLVMQSLLDGSDMLPNNVMFNCFWHSWQFFSNHGPVHYNELIAYWIMEGYLGVVDRIDKVYRRGHHVLMELIDGALLKNQEDNVVMEGELLSILDHRRRGYCGTSNLGLANVLDDSKWEGLGRIALADSMIRTLGKGKKLQELSTLLLDGYLLHREVPDKFFELMHGLQVLAIFNSKLKSLPLPLSSMNKLTVLVLRGCDFLQNIDQIQNLTTLTALEISGASSLENIPDIFQSMTHLQSLNLSAFKITSLPSSIFKLSGLRWLILRGCSHLETLPSLSKIKALEVLDLSGATSLNRIKDRNLELVPKLKLLNLSQTEIDRIPFLHNQVELTRLLLSGCSRLARLPNLKPLIHLQVLDLSGARGLKEIPDESFENMNDLKILDLSQTAISRLSPMICNLHYLYLRECSLLEKLPRIGALKDLKLLDLSDASSLTEFEDASFDLLRCLQCIILSKAKITNLPSLSNLGNLRKLLVRDCSRLETLPEMKGLIKLEFLDLSGATSLKEILPQHLDHQTLRELLLPGCSSLVKLPHLNSLKKLEVLDLSGCGSLVEIQDESFEHMSQLRKLNISKTKIKSLPSLSNLGNLCHLLLRDCPYLNTLPPLESISNLEELDLCGAMSLKGIQAEFLEHMIHLQVLNLSGTPVEKLPSMSKLTSLTQLSLEGCLQIKTVLDLEALTKLEVLNLSGTAVEHLPPLNTFSSLCQLFLRGCSNLKELPLLESLHHLEVLSLSGTQINVFSCGILELTNLKRLDVADMKDFEGIEWGKLKCLPNELNWDECGTSKPGEILKGGNKPSISLRGTQFFELLAIRPNLWETCFNRFHFSVYPFEQQGKDREIYFHRDEFLFKDVYYQLRHFTNHKEHDRSLEICGFNSFPSGIEFALRHSEFVSLRENTFISSLSDLGAENVKGMKGCWIERCSKMGSILSGEENKVSMGKNLEILWVSNLVNLIYIYGGNVQSESFENLKDLYLDSCPRLMNVFSSSQLPENLEILHIKFCHNLRTVFEHGTVAECALPKLHTLHLVGLPMLKSIEAALPSLHTLHVHNLPNLESIGSNLPSLRTSKIAECPKFKELPQAANNKFSQ